MITVSHSKKSGQDFASLSFSPTHQACAACGWEEGVVEFLSFQSLFSFDPKEQGSKDGRQI
jgi:hypothetical protein